MFNIYIHNTPNWKQHRYPSESEWWHQLWCTLTVEYTSAKQKPKTAIDAHNNLDELPGIMVETVKANLKKYHTVYKFIQEV